MSHLKTIQRKIKSLSELLTDLERYRFFNKKIVFTNGCFDLLHVGHLQTLTKAAELGNLLIVGLNSDASVKRLKGSSRPLNTETDRALLLAGLSCVDCVVLFEEDTPLNLITAILPNILVKGGDYKKENIVGASVVEEYGGEVVTIPLVDGKSTTNIIQDLSGF